MKGNGDPEKMSVFEQIKAGLGQAIDAARGELTVRTTVLPAPAPKLTKARVVAIRKKAGMSQGVLAAYLNVPKRTLESWEQGRRSPKAGEARLLQLVEADPKTFESLVSSVGGKRGAKGKGKRRAA